MLVLTFLLSLIYYSIYAQLEIALPESSLFVSAPLSSLLAHPLLITQFCHVSRGFMGRHGETRKQHNNTLSCLCIN